MTLKVVILGANGFIGSALTTLVMLRDITGERPDVGFTVQITLWLWFTVLFANFAEAVAEGRSKAQAAALRGLKQAVRAKKLASISIDSSSHVGPKGVFNLIRRSSIKSPRFPLVPARVLHLPPAGAGSVAVRCRPVLKDDPLDAAVLHRLGQRPGRAHERR